MRHFIKSEARYPNLWKGCVGAWCPKIQGAAGVLLHDYSVSRNHGTLTNMDPASDWVVSGGGYSLDFDGSDDYVVTSNLPPITNVTFAAWVNAITPSDALGIISYSYLGAPTNKGYLVYILPSTGKVYMDGRSNGSAYLSTGASTTDIRGAWHHVCGRKQDVGTSSVWSIWVDGSQQNSSTNASSSGDMNPFTGHRIGNGTGTDNIYRYKGQMDDVRIYDRALTETEIKLLASRRGIAYETTHRRSYKAASTVTSNNNQLIGSWI